MTCLIDFFKYSLVGAMGVLIDFYITYLCKEKIKINRYIANSVGFCMANISNYIFNRIWTFNNSNPDIAQQYMTFFIISVFGLILNNFLLYLLQRFHMNFYLAKIFTTIIVAIWNFTANYKITFA